MKNQDIKNALIKKVSLTMADHGCLTFFLTLDGGSWACSYGGFCIGKGYLGADKFEGSAKGMEALMRIMDIIGVECWEDLENKYVRVVDPGWGGTIKKIGNIINDKWFDIEEFFKKEE